MRKLAIGTIALALLVCGVFFSVVRAQDQAQDQGRPNAVMEETKVDLGQIYEQEKYTHVFKIKNTGKADLHVTKVKPG